MKRSSDLETIYAQQKFWIETLLAGRMPWFVTGPRQCGGTTKDGDTSAHATKIK